MGTVIGRKFAAPMLLMRYTDTASPFCILHAPLELLYSRTVPLHLVAWREKSDFDMRMIEKWIRAQARRLKRYGRAVSGANARERQLAKVTLSSQAVKKLFIGADRTAHDGWVAIDRDVFNVLESNDWLGLCAPGSLDAITTDHVWEDLTAEEGSKAAKHCFTFLKPGGRLRVAVPDGWNPRPPYIEHVRPGGTGPGAKDHKVLYNRVSLEHLLHETGFATEAVEYFDESGSFHFKEWQSDDGYIKRSSRFDYRNRESTTLNYTSLIIDAIKPSGPAFPKRRETQAELT